MKKICVATGTRAEYGLLKPLIVRFINNQDIKLNLLVTGTHLCPEFGMTYNEIVNDEIPIDDKVEVLLSSNTNVGVAKSIGLAIISFAEYFSQKKPGLLVVLGDRFEMFACASAAALLQIPIAHLYGGELTEGAIDEFIRHSITKMSSLHFVSCEAYRKRVIQLGEQPDSVFNVGGLGVENIISAPLISHDKLSKDLDFDFEIGKYCVVTFHPVTLENTTAEKQLFELMAAMDKFQKMKYLITKSNADADGRKINLLWEKYIAERENCLLVTSLGMVRYLSALKNCVAMIGNSSSGLHEGPVIGVPTVDIGDRQRGRFRAESVIHCEPNNSDIKKAMERAFSSEFREFCMTVKNPYGDGNTSEKIMKIIENRLKCGISVKKKFYDIDYVI